MSFKNNIQQFFPDLFEKWGFEFVNVINDCGGNIVIAQSDKLRVRFVCDRADFFLDIGRVAEPDRWIEFYKVIDQLKEEGHVTTGYKYSNKIGPVSRLLDQCFPQIQRFFSESP